MSFLASLLDRPLIDRLGWVLLHSLWQGALVAVCFGLLRAGLRRRSANARYLAGCFTLMLLVVVPIATVLLGATGGAAGASARIAVYSPTVPIMTIATSGASPGTRTADVFRQAAALLEAAVPWLVAAWAVGVGIFSLRLLQGCWLVRRLRKNATDPLGSDWFERLADLKCRLNVSRPVRLFKSTLVEVPTVVGWLKPVILLPACSLSGLAPAQLEAILAHELAHICRHDYLVNALQNVVEILMFYHPAAWWISRCIREEREHCCDDLVVEVCGDRLGYARALATLEERRGVLAQVAFAAGGGSLLHRIRRLLGLPSDPAETGWRQYAGLVLLGMGLVMIVAGTCLGLAPARYEATARIKVAPEISVSPLLNDSQHAQPADNSSPRLVHTEIEVIQSRAVLEAVNAKLGLSESWGKETAAGKPLTSEETCQLLRRRILVRPVSDTSLIEIQAWSRDPKEAARLANTIADVYREFRLQQNRDCTLDAIKALQDSWDEQQTKVHEAQSRVDRLRTELSISDPDPASTGPDSTLSADALRQLQGKLIALEAEQVRMETQLKHLQQLDARQLRAAIQVVAGPDVQLNSLLGELNVADQKLIAIKTEHTPDHPVYRTAREQVDSLNRKIKERVDGLMTGLANRVESGRAAIDELKTKLEQAKKTDLEIAEKSRPYYEAKQRLAELTQFRTILSMKIASEQTDLALPRKALAEIVDRAMPPIRRAGPMNSLSVVALIVLGFLSSTAGLVMSRANRGFVAHG